MAQQTPKAYHPLSGIVLQRQLESKAYVVGGENYMAPGQLVGDFLAARSSKEFGDVLPSYKPGVSLGNLAQVLPSYAIEAMREALPVFGRKIKGYDMQDAVLTFVVLTCFMFSAINFPSVGAWVWLGAKLEHYLQQDTVRRVFNWTMALFLVVSMLPVLFV